MKSYRGDPYWLKVKYPAICRKCGQAINKGDEAFRYKDGSLYGSACECGHEAEKDFRNMAEVEAFYGGGMDY